MNAKTQISTQDQDQTVSLSALQKEAAETKQEWVVFDERQHQSPKGLSTSAEVQQITEIAKKLAADNGATPQQIQNAAHIIQCQITAVLHEAINTAQATPVNFEKGQNYATSPLQQENKILDRMNEDLTTIAKLRGASDEQIQRTAAASSARLNTTVSQIVGDTTSSRAPQVRMIKI